MYLVTGAAGFIGSCLVKTLNDLGNHDLILVDRLKDTSKWLNMRGLKFLEYIHADDFSKKFHHGVKGIYHLGACSSTTETNMDYLMENNVEFSKKLFLYATEKKIPFVYASSAATYGAGEAGYHDSSISDLKPLNPYGYSKQLFDEWVLKQKATPKSWQGLKFFNVYGPNEYHKAHMRSVVVSAFEQIRDTGKVKLFKSYDPKFLDGEQKRDFIYVKDVVNAMVLFMKHESDSGIFNLGTGTARTFNDLAIATFRALNKPVNIEYIEMPANLKKQYQYFTEADMSKFKKVFSDFKFYSLEDGILDYVKNYLNTENPYMVK